MGCHQPSEDCRPKEKAITLLFSGTDPALKFHVLVFTYAGSSRVCWRAVAKDCPADIEHT
jgi:hypothetical protein